MAKEKGIKRTAAAPPKVPYITVGITDHIVLYGGGDVRLPKAELHIELRDPSGRRVPPSKKDGRPAISTPRHAVAFLTFPDVTPGTKYTASAYRVVVGVEGPKRYRVGEPKTVSVPKGKLKGDTDLLLKPGPTITLLEATYIGDQGVIKGEAVPMMFTRKHRSEDPDPRKSTIRSVMGDSGVSAKPEFKVLSGAAIQRKNKWNAATYKVGSRAKFEAKFEVSLPDNRSYSLDEIVLNQRATDLHLRFKGKLTRSLKDGDVFTLMLIADEDLPDYVERWEEDYAILAVYGNGHARFHVANPRHHILIFGLLGKPHGGVEIRNGHVPPFPEQGPPQSITPQRVARAVTLARGAKTADVAIRRIASKLHKGGFSFNPFYAYSTPQDKARNGERLTPRINLHHYLWLAMVEPRLTHCLDLAAAMLLVVRMLGIVDSLSVERIWPWASWHASDGSPRDLDKSGEPWQGSLSYYRGLPDGQSVTFFAGGAPNFFEGVLKWTPASGKPVLFAIGEDSLEFSTMSGPEKDANATVFLQASPTNRKVGRFDLMVHTNAAGEVVKPPFHFQRSDQVRFRFEYDKDTFKPGDDKEPS